jgi:hypothetical protein
MDSMIEFIDTLFTQLRTTGNYYAIADLHILQFTITRALGFSVFTSRILATAIILQTANSVQVLFSKAHIPAGWRLETHLSSSESESYVTTDGQSASLSWNKAHISGLRPDIY